MHRSVCSRGFGPELGRSPRGFWDDEVAGRLGVGRRSLGSRTPASGLGLFLTCLWGGVLAPRSPGSHADRWMGLPPASAAEREKRDSQGIIDALRDTLEERNATVESLQRALDEADMLCSTLKVGPGPWGRGRGAERVGRSPGSVGRRGWGGAPAPGSLLEA